MNEELLELFMKNEVRIIFRKKTNGLIRELLGTLNKTYIPPEQYGVLSKIVTSLNESIIVVWDIESNDWRSFYMDSVINMFESENISE